MQPVRDDFLPFSRPSFGPEEEGELIECLRSGWITTGPRTQRLEAEFAAKTGAAHAMAVNSGTAALHVALLALGVGPGQEVLTTPFTWVSTANVAVHCGASVALADIEPATLNLAADAVEQKLAQDYAWSAEAGRLINKASGAALTVLLPVHYAGQCCDMERLMALAERYNLAVVEDAAHAVGSTFGQRHAGALGALGCFSFYANKNMTSAEGGMIVTNDDALAARARRLAMHGLDRDAWKRYAKGGAWYQVIHEPGYKYNMTDLAAALALHQLAKVEGFNARRRELCAIYDQMLEGATGLRLTRDLGRGRHARHLYPVIVEPGAPLGRAELIEGLAARNIGCGVHYVPVPEHPYYQGLGLRLAEYPQADLAWQGEVSLPLFPAMTDDDAAYVADSVRGLLEAAAR